MKPPIHIIIFTALILSSCLSNNGFISLRNINYGKIQDTEKRKCQIFSDTYEQGDEQLLDQAISFELFGEDLFLKSNCPNYHFYDLFDLYYQVNYFMLNFRINFNMEYFDDYSNPIGFSKIKIHNNKLHIQQSDYYKDPTNIQASTRLIKWSKESLFFTFIAIKKLASNDTIKYYRRYQSIKKESNILALAIYEVYSDIKDIPFDKNWETHACLIKIISMDNPEIIQINYNNELYNYKVKKYK